MERKDRNLIIGVIIVGVIAILGSGIPNLPDKYEVVIANEVGAPLGINEAWNEQGIFEVKISEMKEIPIDSLLMGEGEIQQEYALYDWQLKSYKGRGITRAVEVIFEYKNINYSGDGKSGLYFTILGFGYDKNGQSVKDFGYDKDGQFVKDSDRAFDYLGGNNGYFGWDGRNGIGGLSTNNRLILLIEENTSRIELEFMTSRGASGKYYKKYFYYELSEKHVD